jgi:hypothetical protein
MTMCNDGFGGFSAYESSDGEKLAFSKIRFSSDAAARGCLEDYIRKGEITIDGRESLLDKYGEMTVGQRIIGHDDLGGAGSGFILSQDDDYIVAIDSTSLRHALIFENQVRKY